MPHQPPLFTLPARVYYADTDAGGVVYHARYLEFFERCRSEWLRSLGYAQPLLQAEHGLVFVVRSAQLDYLRPARLDDLLTVTLGLAELTRTRLVISQRAMLAESELACARIELVCVALDRFKPVSIPDWLRAALEPKQ